MKIILDSFKNFSYQILLAIREDTGTERDRDINNNVISEKSLSSTIVVADDDKEV